VPATGSASIVGCSVSPVGCLARTTTWPAGSSGPTDAASCRTTPHGRSTESVSSDRHGSTSRFPPRLQDAGRRSRSAPRPPARRRRGGAHRFHITSPVRSIIDVAAFARRRPADPTHRRRPRPRPADPPTTSISVRSHRSPGRGADRASHPGSRALVRYATAAGLRAALEQRLLTPSNETGRRPPRFPAGWALAPPRVRAACRCGGGGDRRGSCGAEDVSPCPRAVPGGVARAPASRRAGDAAVSRRGRRRRGRGWGSGRAGWGCGRVGRGRRRGGPRRRRRAGCRRGPARARSTRPRRRSPVRSWR
jgi:hypothetical protein